ncbi:MAG: hypothetical protein HN564_01050 [Flavobacteriales bacterium]|nr:hypothetical protein [Flavobacteriales bacterium]
MLFIAFIYLLFVPLNRTGLYSILIDSYDYDYIRESSFAFGLPIYMRYLFYFVTSCIGPIIMANIASTIYNGKSSSLWGFFTENIKSLLVLFITLIIVTLYGARGPSTLLVITFFYSLMLLSNKRKIFLNKILLYGSIALILPSLLSLFRNDLTFNIDNLYYSYINIFDRAFGRGILPNMWFFDYHAANGNLGISGIPKLAYIFGIEAHNIQNEISLIYDPRSLDTGTATATFFVQYYLLFGITGLVIALLLLK